VITLTLLHPVQSTPVQSWSFEQDPAIRIGRAVDNHVVLYSAVVSRYHVEIRLTDNQWEVVNLGTNGTYLDGKRVHQAPLTNGSIMRLARSGPNIQIYIDDHGAEGANSSQVSKLRTPSPEPEANRFSSQDPPEARLVEPLAEAVIAEAAVPSEPPLLEEEQNGKVPPPFYVSGRYPLFSGSNGEIPSVPLHPCDHQGAPEGSFICTDCGFPLRPMQAVGPYQVLKALNPLGNTLIAWRGGHTVVLNTLRPDCRDNRDLVHQFEAQAQLLCQLEHPGMPKFFEAFEDGGRPYLVSEMIHGPNLRDWISQRGSMSAYQGVQWALELSRLLDYLHHQTPTYIHRRIQPSNLIRPRIPHGFSQAVLVGFGELDGLSPETATLSGSGGYRAPEQQIGEDSNLSDLYALGATLVYLLTAQDPDAFYRIGDDNFRLQVQEIPNISPEIAHIIEKLTHPQPSLRFESAAAVVEALQPLL
jgi:eukaryotic-like serine/threonine-protein kinase